MAINPKKHEMPTQAPEIRAHNFNEVALGYSAEIAKAEAERCLNCKNRPCVAGCPVKVDGEFHEYALDLSANPDWKGEVDELWFEACQVRHSRVAIDWMRFE